MRRWLAVLGLLVLAACQAPAPATPAAQRQSTVGSSSDPDGLPFNWDELSAEEQPDSKYFAAEVEKSRNRMIVALIGDCYRQLENETELDRCLRRGLVEKFDASGQGEEKCSGQAGLDAYATCVIVGNVTIDFARRLDSNVKIDSAIWNGPRAFGDFLGRVAVANAVAACVDAQTELSATRCAFDWLLSKLDLPEELSRKCAPHLVAEERSSCLGEAATIRFIEERLDQASGLST